MEIDPYCQRHNCSLLNDRHSSARGLQLQYTGRKWRWPLKTLAEECRNCLFLPARRYASAIWNSAKWNSVKWNGTHFRCHWVIPELGVLFLPYIAGMQILYTATMHWDLTATWQLGGGKHRTPDMRYNYSLQTAHTVNIVDNTLYDGQIPILQKPNSITSNKSFVCNLFSRRIVAIFGMLSRRVGLSATAGLSCYSFWLRVLVSSRFAEIRVRD